MPEHIVVLSRRHCDWLVYERQRASTYRKSRHVMFDFGHAVREKVLIDSNYARFESR